MRTPNHGHQVAYNAQIAVDGEHKLIAAFELTNEGNGPAAAPSDGRSKPRKPLKRQASLWSADTGYSSGEQGERCEAGADHCRRATSADNQQGRRSNIFIRDRFTYDAARDSYQCPAGQTLRLGRVSYTEEKKLYWNGKACRSCALKPQCTKAGKRTIVRSFHEEAREAMHRRAMSDPKWMRLRRQLVDIPSAP